jgi:Carboxypeptidase regulatory-like domain
MSCHGSAWHGRAGLVWLVALLCFGTLSLMAQVVSPRAVPRSDREQSKPASYRIAGRVVSALDGHPLRRTTVRLSEVRSGQLVATTLSGPMGEFAFEGLRPEKYSLTGALRGYIAAAYEEHEQYSTAIVTGAGVDTESLVLRLSPAATISGRVVDEAGEPVRGAQLMLYHEVHTSGKAEIVPVSGSATDDLGSFSTEPLREGKYFVAAKATPWYAMHRPSAATATEGAIVAHVDPALDVAYPVTFYRDATDAEAATPIQLNGGDRVVVDLHLTPLRAMRVSIRTTPGEQASYPQLQSSVFGRFEPVNAQIQSSATETEIMGLPPGRYRLAQTDPKTGSAKTTKLIDLTSGVVAVGDEAGEELATVNVLLEAEGGGKLPAQSQVVLRGTHAGNEHAAPSSDKGEAVIQGVPPDDYHFQVFGQGGLYGVTKIKVAGEWQVNHHLHVSGGEMAVTVRVASAVSAVEGVVQREGKPVSGTMVLLVPVDAIDDVDLFRRDQSDLDGTFSLPNVSAGRYIVLAITEGWKLDWGNPSVLTPYLAKGVPIEIPASGQPIKMHDALVAQPR